MPPEWELVRAWLERAQNDLRAAEVDLGAEPPLTDDACFHCQQATEKALKAYLTWRGVEFAHTHQIELLIEQCRDLDPGFVSLHESADELTAFAVRFRYPFFGERPSAARAGEALSTARHVVRFVFDRVPPQTHPGA